MRKDLKSNRYHILNCQKTYYSLVCLLIIFSSCTKLVTIGPPSYSIKTEEVFADSADAVAAIEGIYSSIINAGGNLNLGSGKLTVDGGSSADDLLPFFSQGDQISTNTLLSTGPTGDLWVFAYQQIYTANSSIEGLRSSTGISQNAKDQLTGEARFFRAFFYFYLVNLYGDVPLLTTSDYRVNAQASRTATSIVYDTIVSDLIMAQKLLKPDYSYSSGDRTRVNALAVTALLARVYLYLQKWPEAAAMASSLIANTSIFNLNTDLDQVFLINNQEAILQWKLNTAYQPFNATPEGYQMVPPDTTIFYPYYYLTNNLLNAFEPNDARRIHWVARTTFVTTGISYFFPYKYKIGPNQATPNATATESYTVFRLAEQYLIRAEARAHNNDLLGAAADIDTIRSRAGLLPTSASTQEELLDAVAQERRIEFFAEWGHRWFDLKRTGKIDPILRAIKPLWKSYQQLYPVPFSERQLNPNLTQNPGYN